MIIALLHRLVLLRYKNLGMLHRRALTRRFDLSIVESRREPDADRREPALLLHGLGTSSSTWGKVISAFPPNLHIVAPDLPGFGFSSHIANRNPEIRDLDEAVHAIADECTSGSFTLVGHSLGGWLAMRFAARYPNRVSRLILLNPAGVYYPGVEAQAEAFALPSKKSVRHLMSLMWFRFPWYFRPFIGSVYAELHKRGVPQFVHSVTKEDFVNPLFGALSMPIFLLWGSEDRLISSEARSILQRACPWLTLYEIDQCGHIPQLERPQEVRRILGEIFTAAR